MLSRWERKAVAAEIRVLLLLLEQGILDDGTPGVQGPLGVQGPQGASLLEPPC